MPTPFHGNPNIHTPLPSSKRPTQLSKQSARRSRRDPSHLTTYVDTPMDTRHVELRYLPPSPLQGPEVVTGDVPTHDGDGEYVDPGPSTFRPSALPSEGLLSPLSFHQEWEPSGIPFSDHSYHSTTGHDHTVKLSPLGDLQATLKGISDADDDSPFRRSYSSFQNDCDECLSPASMITESDTDDESLMSSVSSLSPSFEDSYRPHDPSSDHEEDDCNALSQGQWFPPCKPHRSGYEPIYHIEEYPPTSPIVSPFESHPQRAVGHLCPYSAASSSTSPPPHTTSVFSPSSLLTGLELSPPSPLYGFYDEFSPSGIPSSPSRRRSSSLPDDEEDVGEGGSKPRSSDSFGLGSGILYDEPSSYLSSPTRTRFLSLPGADTDDDLIPLDLASKNYIPDPTVGDFSAPLTRSLLLWDTHSAGDVDVPTPRSPSPEMFYLPPSLLAECQDEEMQKVYQLRERTARTSAAVRGDRKGRWERERCRELSALLRLKLDERGVLPSGSGGSSSDKSSTGADAEVSTSGEETPTISPTSPSSSSPPLAPIPSSSQLPQKPNPKTSSSSSSSASKYPKITSMAQLVANMVFHRQDALKRYLARSTPSRLSNTPVSTTTSPKTAAALPISRSPLSQVILPEGMEGDDDGDEAVRGVFVETGVEGVSAGDGHDEDRERWEYRGRKEGAAAHRAATDPQIQDGWSSSPSLVCGLPTVDQAFARAETI